MSPALRGVTFVVGLVIAFAVAVGVGRAAGPDVTDDVADEQHGSGAGHGEPAHDARDAHATEPPAFEIELADTSPQPGNRRLAFRILDAEGEPLRDYDVVHEKRLHLIVVGTPGLTSFQHVHPDLGADGRWTTRLSLGPGTYEVYADATTSGENFVATARLDVPGSRPAPGSVPAATVLEHSQEYAVAMTRAAGQVTFSVSRNGRPVTDLQPYLGADGHLVVIEAGSLAYVHAHPLDGPAGPQVSFEVADAADTKRRLFFEFKHAGHVRRVAFTAAAPAGGSHEEGHGHEH